MSRGRSTSVDTLTSEQHDFLSGKSASQPPVAANVPPSQPPPPVRPATPTKSDSRWSIKKPAMTPEIAGRISRQPVTVRLPADVAETLRRVCAERTINYHEPRSQQAIVEDALRRWLSRYGYT